MLNTILIVEDDELLCSLYTVFLRSKDIDVVCAHSLAQARGALDRLLTLDAVILDNHLGDGDSLQLVSLIKQQFLDCSVVIVSGESKPEFFIEAFAEGADNYLLKPVNLELLWVTLMKSRSGYQLKRQNEQQQQKLAAWVDLEKREHELARHVFDALIGRVETGRPHLQVFSHSSSTFCGDLVLQQTGMDGSYYLMLADSMGHGLAAAIALLPVIEVFQAMSRKSLSLSHLVFELNDKLLRQLPPDRFVAAVIIRVDPHLQQIHIWNGGMPSLFLLSKTGALLADAGSRHMALGILPEQQLDLSYQVVSLAEVERVVGYTDGFTDNFCKNGQQLNRPTILQLCQQYADLNQFEQSLDLSVRQDDMTIFSLMLPALQQHQADAAPKRSTGGGFGLNLKLEGRMLQGFDAGNQIVRMLQVCDMPQQLCARTFSVLTELFLNALEHGVLGLSSQLKQEDNGFLTYYEEKEKRLEQLADTDVIEIALQWQAGAARVEIMVKDSGQGFQQQKPQSDDEAGLSGRGIEMIRSLCSEVEYRGNGNEVRVVINR
jgi:DNA-binding response OmpR family regulator